MSEEQIRQEIINDAIAANAEFIGVPEHPYDGPLEGGLRLEDVEAVAFKLDELDKFARLREQAALSAKSVPNGYVLVPIEPTEEMVIQAWKACPLKIIDFTEAWKAMIAAAPPLPTDDDRVRELEKEIARLDFVLKESAFIMKSETDTKQTVYQLWAQDEDEYFWSLCGNTFHKTPRLAIDCAMQTPEEARTKVEF